MKKKTSHIFDFPLSGVRFHCYRQHLCSAYSFDFTDKGHRRTLDSQDKRKPHCLLSQFMWRRFLHAMLQLGISHRSTNQNDETSTMVGRWRANVILQRQMSKDSIFMHVWRLNLVWQERSINMEWRPRKNWFWNFVKSQITDSGVYSRTN